MPDVGGPRPSVSDIPGRGGGSAAPGRAAGTNAAGAAQGGAGTGATTGSVTGGQAPMTTSREGGDAGIGGPRGTGSAQGGDACNDVLAKPGNFTRQVIEECRKRTGRDPAPRTAGPDTAVNPVDAPSQVQKAREPQDKSAVRSICTNCEPGAAPAKSGQKRGSGG